MQSILSDPSLLQHGPTLQKCYGILGSTLCQYFSVYAHSCLDVRICPLDSVVTHDSVHVHMLAYVKANLALECPRCIECSITNKDLNNRACISDPSVDFKTEEELLLPRQGCHRPWHRQMWVTHDRRSIGLSVREMFAFGDSHFIVIFCKSEG